MTKKKQSRAATNASVTYSSGIKTGTTPSHRSPDGPCRCENYVHANPDKYLTKHPPASETVSRRTQNPASKPITGRVLRAK